MKHFTKHNENNNKSQKFNGRCRATGCNVFTGHVMYSINTILLGVYIFYEANDIF